LGGKTVEISFDGASQPCASHRTGIYFDLLPSVNVVIGPLWSIQTQATYVLSPSSLIQLQFGYNRQEAQISPYSYSGFWIGGGYQQDLPFGFSAGFRPSFFAFMRASTDESGP